MRARILTVAAAVVVAELTAVADFKTPPEPQDVPPLTAKSVADWENVERPRLLKTFQEEVYGVRPVERPPDLAFAETAAPEECFGGKAIRKRVRATYSGPGGSAGFDFSVWIPTADHPVAVFIHSSPRPAETAADENGPRPAYWLPAEDIVSRGYAAVAYCNQEVALDFNLTDVATGGVFKAFGNADLNHRRPTEWGIISAWAWGMSRIADWIEAEPLLDAKRIATVGLSRNGKTSLLAGATDPRFGLVISCCSGCSGAKLNHLQCDESETIRAITDVASKWFAPNYLKYANHDRDAALPFDQHQFLALVAPRLLYVSSASEDAWAGPRGEFASAALASKVWNLYGKAGLVHHGFPKPDMPLHAGNVGYHLRSGVHDITRYDWQRYMDFADGHGWNLAFGACGAVAVPQGEVALAEPSAAEPLPVILPDDPSPSQRYAAEEYAAYMGRVSGRTVRVLPSGSAAHGVRLVTADQAEGLGDDGFRLRVTDGGLEIRGSRVRGCLYGVYEVLERFGGCRWYASWCERVPRRLRVTVPKDLDVVERPAFEMRQPWWHDVKTHPLFAARNKVNGFNHTGDIEIPAKIGGDSFRFGGGLVSCHTFNLLCDPKEHFEAHPEYFSMVGGKRLKERTQLCLTNPDVLDLVTSNVLARIRRDPTARFFGVSQNDWANWCECPSCKALDDAEGSHAGTTISFVNAIAERVEREFPDVTIETLAYMYTRNLPKTVRPRRNVLVCLCTWECDFASPLNRSRYSSNVAFCRDIADWRGCCPNLYVWDYVTDFDNYQMPFADWDALVGNVRFFRDHDVKYLFEQGDGQGRHADFAELRAWLLAKLMWNPDQPVEPLLDDFFAGYYGKGAPFVRACFDEVRALGRSWAAEHPLQRLSIYGQPTDPILTDAFLERAERLWQRAEEATKDDPDYAYNVRMGAFAIASTRLDRLRTRYNESGAQWLADAPDFEGDLAQMRTWARRSLAALEEAGNIRLVETRGQDAVRIAAWKAILTPTPGLSRPTARQSITFGPDAFLLGESASRVAADGANGGKAMRLDAVPSRVDEVICLLRKIFFAPGESYRLRVRARIAHGAVLRVAVLVYGNLEQTSATLSAREGEDGWAWYDVGEWIPKGTDFVSFVREGSDSNAEILIDSIEISRQPLRQH